MILATFLGFAILVGLILPSPSWAEEIPILGALPSHVHEIDITYSESAPPRLSFRSSPPTSKRAAISTIHPLIRSVAGLQSRHHHKHLSRICHKSRATVVSHNALR